MERLSYPEIERRLSGPYQAVLSVSRDGRGPVAVPMSFQLKDGQFWMITSPDSLHGKLIREMGRATLTIQDEELGHRAITQWYVMAEGPIEFTDADPVPLLRPAFAKDRGEEFADEWAAQSLPNVTTVAVLTPQTLSGYIGSSRLD